MFVITRGTSVRLFTMKTWKKLIFMFLEGFFGNLVDISKNCSQNYQIISFSQKMSTEVNQ